MPEKLRPRNLHLDSFQDYENSIKTYHSKWINSRENIDQLIISNKAFKKYYGKFVERALIWAEKEYPADAEKRKECAMQYRRQLEQILFPQTKQPILKLPEITKPQLPVSQRKNLID